MIAPDPVAASGARPATPPRPEGSGSSERKHGAAARGADFDTILAGPDREKPAAGRKAEAADPDVIPVQPAVAAPRRAAAAVRRNPRLPLRPRPPPNAASANLPPPFRRAVRQPAPTLPLRRRALPPGLPRPFHPRRRPRRRRHRRGGTARRPTPSPTNLPAAAPASAGTTAVAAEAAATSDAEGKGPGKPRRGRSAPADPPASRKSRRAERQDRRRSAPAVPRTTRRRRRCQRRRPARLDRRWRCSRRLRPLACRPDAPPAPGISRPIAPASAPAPAGTPSAAAPQAAAAGGGTARSPWRSRGPTTGKVEIRLDPPELGRVQIHLTPLDRGGVQAVVLAERPGDPGSPATPRGDADPRPRRGGIRQRQPRFRRRRRALRRAATRMANGPACAGRSGRRHRRAGSPPAAAPARARSRGGLDIRL